MKNILHIDDISKAEKRFAGDKAFNIALLKKSGANVPESLALTTNAYKKYLKESDINTFILREIKRKDMNDYRWEELWDISLRIKNAFIRHKMSKKMQQEIISNIDIFFDKKPVAVRSSAPGEDGTNSSFAGLHESYINLTSRNEILKHIRLVWASLWSVSALLYRRELKLDPFKSAMAVLVQEVIAGESSGVAFSQSPDRPDCIAIEAVYGLNQGLVDGTVEPDHWNIERKTMRICDFFPASEHKKTVQPSKDKVSLKNFSPDKGSSAPLNNEQVKMVAEEAMNQERHFGHPRDIEWTFHNSKMFILQSRPITKPEEDSDQRQYYDKLLLSFDQLKNIRSKLEDKILPGMLATGKKWKQEDVVSMDSSDLLKCLIERGREYRNCLKTYDEYCIPFAHGVRLFGEVYNSRLDPDDPYEFVDLLRTGDLLSLQRNRKINIIAENLDKVESESDETAILDQIEEVFDRRYSKISEMPSDLLNLIRSYEDTSVPEQNKSNMEDLFIKSFEEQQISSALELLDIGRASYRLRDDDNIYLDEVKSGLKTARSEVSKRLKNELFSKTERFVAEKELSEEIPELHSPGIGNSEESYNDDSVKFRQLTGQPAGKGIAKGNARVIEKFDDLFAFRKNEILVCDAVEPEMTIVAPLAAAVIERRGGMLIHGAIIAREYGLPCVTGVPDATRKIKNGDLISVDGWLGIVTIL